MSAVLVAIIAAFGTGTAAWITARASTRAQERDKRTRLDRDIKLHDSLADGTAKTKLGDHIETRVLSLIRDEEDNETGRRIDAPLFSFLFTLSLLAIYLTVAFISGSYQIRRRDDGLVQLAVVYADGNREPTYHSLFLAVAAIFLFIIATVLFSAVPMWLERRVDTWRLNRLTNAATSNENTSPSEPDDNAPGSVER